MGVQYMDNFRDISQIEALAIIDRRASATQKPFVRQAPPQNQPQNDILKKELGNLKRTLGQRNEKIKELNADKISLQNQVKALESRLAYFEQFKKKTRHQVGTDEFLKIIESVNK